MTETARESGWGWGTPSNKRYMWESSDSVKARIGMSLFLFVPSHHYKDCKFLFTESVRRKQLANAQQLRGY